MSMLAIKELSDKLEQGITDLFSSEKYKDYIKTMSQFHAYSFSNSLLIAMELNARGLEDKLVSSYTGWKNMDRQVKKGAKGIAIRCPCILKKDNNSSSEETESEEVIQFFKIGYVFPLSATEGKDLPEIVTMLKGEVKDYGQLFEAIQKSLPDGVSVSFEKIANANGYFDKSTNQICINEGMSQEQTIKTFVHEVAHAYLDAKADGVDRATKEVRAESTAYMVCSSLGIDTSEYSFGYVVGWSSGKELKELKSELETIHNTASMLIDKIQVNMLRLVAEKEAAIINENTQKKGRGR